MSDDVSWPTDWLTERQTLNRFQGALHEMVDHESAAVSRVAWTLLRVDERIRLLLGIGEPG